LGLMSWRSPVDSGRVVTALLAGQPQRLPILMQRMVDPKANFGVQGDLAVLSDTGFTSLRANRGFWTGDLPFYLRLMWWLSRTPLSLAVAAVAGSFIIAAGLYALLKLRAQRRVREFGE